MLYIIGITITFFLALILLSKKNKSTADQILSFWLLVIGVHLVFYYFFITKKYIHYPFLLGLELPLPLLHGPLVYMYSAFLTRQLPYRGYIYIHFIPILFIYLLFADFFFLPSVEKITVYQQQGFGYTWRLLIHQVLVFVSGPIYVILSLILLSKHRRKIVREFSDLEKINLTWLRYLVLGIAVTWIFVFIGNDEYVFGSVVVYVLFIGYFGIKQVGVFTNIDYTKPSVFAQEITIGNSSTWSTMSGGQNYPNTESIVDLGQPKGKYHKSGLNDEDAESIHQELIALMQKEKCFRNGELTLTELSQKLNVHSNYLSQVINSLEGKNFYDYINSQRVEEFKQLLKQPENQKYTLLYLAFECGFNSKTSFNRNFKHVTGLSPSEYLKEANISLPKDE